MATSTDTHAAIEQVARDSYGRLIAYLAARSRDVASAEDALADAFHSALQTWPSTGVPAMPEAWLLIAARRRLIDQTRHSRVQEEAVPQLLALTNELVEMAIDEVEFPDERLKLLFLCAHPAIDPAVRTPLMLQVVLGLDAVRIASAFLVQPTTMGQRLSRAKRRIRDARIPFDVPRSDLPGRLDSVLEAVYGAYGTGWEDVAGADPRRRNLAAEALQLGRLLVRLLPDEPEALGLLALMLHCEARRDARQTDGGYVPLSQQETTRWSKEKIAEAEGLLNRAAESGRIGRFQLEAAIQSVHAQRAQTGETNWEAIALLYEGLVRLAPTIGATVARAAALAAARGPAEGYAELESIPAETVKAYQPYWAVAASLLSRMGRLEEASAAYGRAMGLCENAGMREFLAKEEAAMRPDR